MTDNIKEPKHYTQYKIEPIDFIISNNLDFCTGNIIKYVLRYNLKNGVRYNGETLTTDKRRDYLNRGELNLGGSSRSSATKNARSNFQQVKYSGKTRSYDKTRSSSNNSSSNLNRSRDYSRSELNNSRSSSNSRSSYSSPSSSYRSSSSSVRSSPRPSSGSVGSSPSRSSSAPRGSR